MLPDGRQACGDVFTCRTTDQAVVVTVYVCLQEAQLSQRDRAMLRVVKYLAKSLKVIENGTI